MKKNNKGFTLIEIILSLSIAAVTLFTLFQIIFIVRNIYADSGLKVKLLQKQLIINEKVNSDFYTKKLIMVRKCSSTCMEFTFQSGEVKRLEYERSNKILKYGDFSTKLIGQSTFGNISMSTEKNYDVSTLNTDSLLLIDIPVYNPSFKGENFGLKLVYQYNSNLVSIDSVNIHDNISNSKEIYLIGGDEYTIYTSMVFEDPGYYLRNSNGTLIENSNEVTVTGTVPSIPGVYNIVYTYKDSMGNVIDTKTRTVTVLDGVKDFSYINGCTEYTVPTSGTYKLEVWGAQGGSSSEYDLGGKGAYVYGYRYIQANTTLNVCVGGRGLPGGTSNVNGGFNGGGTSSGASTFAGGSGGGATDIRIGTNFEDTIIVAGGGGGSASRNDSTNPSIGGAGGGGTGTSTPTSYNGLGATEESGGAQASFSDGSITKYPTSGSKLNGGTSGLYSTTYSGGAGGGGYYGGGAGVRYGSGGGGSSYCGDTLNCTRYSGDEEFTLYNGTKSIGNPNDGYARITLISF